MNQSAPLLLALAAAPASAQIPICDASGFPAGDPVLVDVDYAVGTGCVIDFGPREVIFTGTGSFQVDSATVRAAKLTLQDGSEITGSGSGTLTIEVTAQGPHDGSTSVSGTIEHDDGFFGGGTIAIITDGDFLLTSVGRLRARGTGFDADGGDVSVTAGGDVTIDGAAVSIDVTSGNDATGGCVTLTSTGGAVLVQEKIDANGGSFDGGEIFLDAATMLVTTDELTVNGGGGASVGFGFGGIVDLRSVGPMMLFGAIRANGPNGTQEEGGGDGGTIDITSDSVVQLGADIQATGGVDGCGGFVTVITKSSFIQQSNKINLRGTGSDSSGGFLDVFADLTIWLAGDTDLSGPGTDFAFGGAAFLDAGTDVMIFGEVLANANTGGCVDVRALQGAVAVSGDLRVDGNSSFGSGGEISIQCLTGLDLSGALLNANGASGDGFGGTVDLICGQMITADGSTTVFASGNDNNGALGGNVNVSGCRVDFPAGSRIHARGNTGGTIAITAQDVLTLGGAVRADRGGAVLLETRLDAPFSPVLAGATIDPAPVVTHTPSLPPCLGLLTVDLTVNSPVPPFASLVAQVDSVPNAQLLVFAGPNQANAPLGANGFTQLDVGSAFALADPFGFAGAVIPGSQTDAAGQWSFVSPPIPPGLAGIVFFLEAYVFDVGALNGLFHQSQLVPLEFAP